MIELNETNGAIFTATLAVGPLHFDEEQHSIESSGLFISLHPGKQFLDQGAKLH